MNLLLITFSFPPAGGVGVLRALSLAKYLPESDVRVDVLTARNAPAVGKDLTLLQQVPSGVTVHRTWTLDLPFWLRKSVKKAVTGGQARQKVAPVSQAPTKAGNPLKRAIGNLLLPDPQVGWLPFAFPAAVRIIRARAIDAVVITVPPFSSVKLASRLRRVFPTLPIIVDFRDEWLTTTLDLVSFNNNSKAREVAQKTESDAVHDASAVVLVTEAARRELQSRYPDLSQEKFLWIPNGYDVAPPTPKEASAAKALQQKIVLTYIGTVYGSTAPGSFIEAVRNLPEAIRSRLHLRFIGHVEVPEYREQLLSLGETVELKGFMPQAEALAAIRDTDYLLLITHDKINVAAKFYDYLGGGKPILGAVHPEGDVRRLLEETRAGLWADVDDSQEIGRMLIQAVETSSMWPEPDYERIAAYHRRPISARYAELLKQIVARARTTQKEQIHR
ncbi:glycosyltransferase [Edaphobacter albus]|uniref:glycosyltransferase n=1 Tax=Edaphobacter sp. 4G125 TaxID=2763071 RepID=UPI0016448F23|nr:glycosyltransferase [Edaphobacter sp. 4G125]QNI36581.1 glycosyltransferase [Edaphobacter sp. 4G125]